MSGTKQEKVTVIRDTREKPGFGWNWPEDEFIQSTEIAKLDTGDYSIKGYEKIFTIERKLSTGEISNNIWEKRFEDELKRLDEFRYPFMILEFSMEDVLAFPINSGIPKFLWPKLRVSGSFLLSAIARYNVVYRTKILFAGTGGMAVARSLFKMIVRYGKKD